MPTTPFAGPPQELLLLVNLVIAITVAEMIWLLARARHAGKPSGPLLANLLAGLGLLLALRLAVGGAGWVWVALALAGAGAAHIADLRARWHA